MPKTSVRKRKRQRRKREQLPLTRHLMTREEFCLENRISRSVYFNLKLNGKAPAEIKIGGRFLISTEAASKWRADLEAAR